ncbi:hypothetical protein [Edaphobacter modestus]|uniref:Uncharacterized protein n=1 Tax=Edaphobacter modestus TaxID=388466 RepID=A0A4Q7YXJ8_9BACT|nr:hypothetical protein [Edaphobacter modestus]RZU41825.1 hypothetical protein BDD14_3362 [Edaphobacter modestus]
MSFIGVLEAVGKGFEKGLKWALNYAIPVEKLLVLLFPAASPVAAEIVDATTLIQNAVLLVEQKYAASGAQSGTGAEKLSEVLLLTEQAVTALLAKAGINADSGFIASIISAVVAILNVQQAQAPATV